MNKKIIAPLFLMVSMLIFIVVNNKMGYFGSEDHADRVALSRNILYLLTLQLFFITLLWRKKAMGVFVKYFSAESHPLNLAIFRIVIFSSILKSLSTSNTLFFSGLSRELLYPPPGLEKIVQILPINPEIALIGKIVLTVSALLAIVGFYTRIAAPIALLAAIYCLGIPQLFGKVNHHHFLIWFGAILAVSPCSDTFSLDAVFRGFRQMKKGALITPAPSREYGLPIRFIFIIFGVLYFFPGFWKWVVCGFDWIVTDNLINLMYNKWYELDEWLPFFRIDQYPLLCHIGAAMTILFELFFLFLLFFDKWRYCAIFNGLFFHNMNWLFMNIPFISLQKCYVIFFDWHKIFAWIGKRIFKQPIRVIVGDSASSQKFVAILKAFDIFEQTEYHGKQAREILIHHKVNGHHLSVIENNEICYGCKAFFALSLRNPIFWGFLPILYLWPKEKTIANDPSKNAIEHVIAHAQGLVQTQNNPFQRKKGMVIVVSSLLIFANIYCGFRQPGGISSWPFSAFPHFAVLIRQPYKTSMKIVLLDKNDEEINFDQEKLSEKFGSSRYWGLVNHIRGEQDSLTMAKKIVALLQVSAQFEPEVKNARILKIYLHLNSTLPENRGLDPIDKKLILNIKLDQ